MLGTFYINFNEVRRYKPIQHRIQSNGWNSQCAAYTASLCRTLDCCQKIGGAGAFSDVELCGTVPVRHSKGENAYI